ncbi:MAG: outer membrane protein assembly factor BamB family protein [Planctomycetota bacterium]
MGQVMIRFFLMCCLLTCVGVGPSATQPVSRGSLGDWSMWGGRPERNMLAEASDLPIEWDIASGRNVKWVAELGTQTFGNPVVSGGKVFIGTNNGRPRNPAIQCDVGVLMCFAERDGSFLWQSVHAKLASGNAQDWAGIGICSTPCVVGDRLYYVSNRGELMCADTEGFRDGQNDGSFKGEKLRDEGAADFVWWLDMLKELRVSPMQASSSSPVVVGDLVFVLTGHGVDSESGEVRNPSAPSFIAVQRQTGRVVWSDNSPGRRILAGQWSSPAWGLVNKKPQVVFPGGDGFLYSFEPETGKLLWKFNCNAGDPPSENHLVATPVIHRNHVYISVGQDPESGDGEGRLWSVDAGLGGDVTRSGVLWSVGGRDFGRSISTVAVCDGLLYAAELGGYLACFDVMTSKLYWRYDLKARVWSSPLAVDGKIYIANEDGEVMVFKQGQEAVLLASNSLPGSVHGSAVVANGVLYVSDSRRLYAIAGPPASQPADSSVLNGEDK